MAEKRSQAQAAAGPCPKHPRLVLVNEEGIVIPSRSVDSVVMADVDRFYRGRTLIGLRLIANPAATNFEVDMPTVTLGAADNIESAITIVQNGFHRLEEANHGRLGDIGIVIFRNRHPGFASTNTAPQGTAMEGLTMEGTQEVQDFWDDMNK